MRIKMKLAIQSLIFTSVLFILSTAVFAWNITAKVTSVEPTYLPNALTFKVDTDAGACGAGNWITWKGYEDQDLTEKQIEDNLKIVYATLMTALLGELSIELLGDDGTCNARFIHLMSK